MSCGDSPIPLNVDVDSERYVFYNCLNQRQNYFCGIWSFHDGKRWDVIITDKGKEEYEFN
jgi:hypothetical protein